MAGAHRQGIDEPRPAPGVLVAFEPAAGDGGLNHLQAAVSKLAVVVSRPISRRRTPGKPDRT
jgi:hypothetical protein